MFSRLLSSASSGLAKATGTDPQSKYNKSVMDLYNLQVTNVQNFGTELVKGLPSAQQKTITKVVYDMIANSIMGYGPISKAISAIKGTHNSKGPIEGVKVPLAEDKLKENSILLIIVVAVIVYIIYNLFIESKNSYMKKSSPKNILEGGADFLNYLSTISTDSFDL